MRLPVIPPYWGFPKSRAGVQNLRVPDFSVIFWRKVESPGKYFRAFPAVPAIGAGLLAGLVLFCGAAEPPPSAGARSSPPQVLENQHQSWRGVHLWLDRESAARELISTLPRLAAIGVNAVVVEVNYSFEFQTHPELRNRRFITRATAHELAAVARRCGIRLIPEFNCLGHQSFGGRAEPLLKIHPDFSETPGQSLTNKNIYCLEWCPQAPGLNEIIFSLIDEMAEAFEADGVHVGMDEVYLSGSDDCPRCRGKNPAELFAAQANALHAHIVDRKKLQMFMWADRVIGPKFQGNSKYDTARNDLSASLDSIPHDIILCDWHYEWRTNYPSVPFLTGQGFRVWPAGFMPLKAALAFSDYAQRQTNALVVGWLATTWNETSITNSPDWPPIKEIIPRWRGTAK